MVGIGKYGPYVRYGKSFASLAKTDDPYTITYDRAVEIVRAQGGRGGGQYAAEELPEDPDMLVKNGRYGPYIAYKGKNYRLPKGAKPKSLTSTNVTEDRRRIEEQNDLAENPSYHKTSFSHNGETVPHTTRKKNIEKTAMKKPILATCALLRARSRGTNARNGRPGRLPFHRRQNPARHPGQGPEPQRNLLVLLDPLVLRKRNPPRRRSRTGPLGDVDRAQHLLRKAVKYIRLHGSLNLAVGGQAHDVLHGIEAYGIVPEEVYPGLNYGYDKPNFDEIDAVIKAYADAVIKAGGKRSDSRLTTAWQAGLNGILDAYFGPMPEKFTYRGQRVPPGIVRRIAADRPRRLHRIHLVHPPPLLHGVRHGGSRQLELGQGMERAPGRVLRIIDNSLEKGYTISWGTDVSRKGFSRTKGLGIVPEADLEGMQGTEAEKWGKLTQKEKDEALYKFDKPGRERTVTQELRQKGYDNYETTDDHGMQIVGTAVDQNGTPYYKVKNSWAQVSSLRRLLVFLAPVRRLQDDDRAGQQRTACRRRSSKDRPQITARAHHETTARASIEVRASLSKFKFLSLKGSFTSRSLTLSPT